MENEPTSSRDALADLAAVCQHASSGIVRDPLLLKRVHERSAKAREQTKEKFGVQNIGAEIIRGIRTME